MRQESEDDYADLSTAEAENEWTWISLPPPPSQHISIVDRDNYTSVFCKRSERFLNFMCSTPRIKTNFINIYNTKKCT